MQNIELENDNQSKKPDIFDKIMHLPVLNIFEPFYKKNKEILMYLFFGVLTTVVSIASYALFDVVLDINELISNVLSWILAVLFAFFTNRIWVFSSPTNTMKEFFAQLVTFAGGRLVTLGIEELIILVFVTLLHFNSMIIKLIAQIVVIVLNYVISKLVVFRNRDK
ncbi:MAG: GtrA family protein [Lachnospira sp.]